MAKWKKKEKKRCPGKEEEEGEEEKNSLKWSEMHGWVWQGWILT